jgi:hypothetical protein
MKCGRCCFRSLLDGDDTERTVYATPVAVIAVRGRTFGLALKQDRSVLLNEQYQRLFLDRLVWLGWQGHVVLKSAPLSMIKTFSLFTQQAYHGRIGPRFTRCRVH